MIVMELFEAHNHELTLHASNMSKAKSWIVNFFSVFALEIESFPSKNLLHAYNIVFL